MEEPSYCARYGVQLVDGSCPACLLKLGLSGAIPPLAEPAPTSPASARRTRVLKWLWPAIAVALLAAAAVLFPRGRTAVEGPLVRFSIPTPGGDGGQVAVSPDGRSLAYSGRGPRGETLLWVHAFDSVEDRPLAGSEDATFPFWSPDSRNLGFFAQGKLKRIDVAGGPPLALCDAPQGRGGTWSMEGEIVVAPGAFGPLFRVPAAGGAPKQLAPVDASRGARAQRWPHFLPDGRHFLYWATMPPQQQSGVFIGSVDSPESRPLVPDTSATIFSNGHLLFVRSNALLAQPFDPFRLVLTGEAQPIAEGAGWSADRGPAFSASNSSTNPGVLAFRAAADPRTQLAWFDRQGKMLGAAGDPGMIDTFSLSPDGTQAVAARRESEDGPSALWVMEFARGVSMRLTFGPLNNPSPIWSPDGSRVLFSTRLDAGTGMFRMPANGSGKEELLLQTPGAVNVDSWSQDGRFVAYAAVDAKGESSIWALPLEGGGRKPMPILQDNFRSRQANFSPDALWIAYISNESGRDEVYVRGFPPREGKWLISSNGGTDPSWRRDGRELFYMSPEGVLTAVEIAPAGSGIRPGIAHALFQTRGHTVYAAAADGRRFLMKAPVEDASPPGVNVIMNWSQQLRK
ncbi:MAG: hypothetical protein LAO55_04705 [Acidobacteriia bacterium]|nr:hypothetical protein [Terriglobia bacterium]